MRADEAIEAGGGSIKAKIVLPKEYMPPGALYAYLPPSGILKFFLDDGAMAVHVTLNEICRNDWEVYEPKLSDDYIASIRIPEIGGGEEHRKPGLDFVGIGPDGKKLYSPCPVTSAARKATIEKLKKERATPKPEPCEACILEKEVINNFGSWLETKFIVFLLKQACTCDKGAE